MKSAGEATEWVSSPWIEWWSGRFGDRRMEDGETPREPDRPGRNDGWTGSGPLVLDWTNIHCRCTSAVKPRRQNDRLGGL